VQIFLEAGVNAAKQKLSSWQNAQQHINEILASLNKNQDLMLAAAANPLLALRELGYEIDEGVEQEFEDRIRFGPHNAPKVGALRDQIFKSAGRRFDVDSPEALAEVLTSVSKNNKNAPTFTPVQTAPVAFTLHPNRPADPLEKLRSAHPIMEPLLEYRRMQTSTPRFATKEFYDEIRQKKRPLPVTKLVAHLKSNS
jgi:DNA polymerase I-like protein with 3'-5' exonuclease and polymerase domains